MPITQYPTGEHLSQDFISLTCAAKLAVKHVNERTDAVVPGLKGMVANLVRLDAAVVDSGFHDRSAADAYLRSANSFDAIVGAARSGSSKEVARLAKLDAVPQCSYWSSSPTLSNKLEFPYFGRTYPSDSITSKVLCSLIDSMGWKAFAVVYDDEDEYSSAMTDQLLVDSRPLQLQLRATASVRRTSDNPYEDAVNALQSSEVNIFVAVLYNQDILGVLQLAKEKGLLGAGT
eukprot:5863971-Prymnesium_polylepis.1